MNKILIISLGILVLIGITIVDYFWIGRKLIGEMPLEPKHLLVFYLGRNIAELIVLFFGILIGGLIF
jgi:hypothetical protein